MNYIGLITAAFFISTVSQRIICWQYQKYYDQLEFPQRTIVPTGKRLIRLTAWTAGIWISSTMLIQHEWYIWLSFGIMSASVMVTDLEQEVILDWFLVLFLLTVMICMPWKLASLWNYLGGLLVCGIVMLALAMLTHGAIGGGDVKLTMSLGCWLGFTDGVTMLIYGLLLGGLAAGVLLLNGRKGRKDTFAYGPYFVLAAWLVKLVNC